MKFIWKIPSLQQIAPVYAVIVAMTYLWSLIQFLWRLPSWIIFSTVGEVAVIFAYMVVVNLVESILILIVPLLMGMILPQAWFYDRFVTRGSSLVLLGLGYLMYFNENLPAEILDPSSLLVKLLSVAVAIIILIILIDRTELLRRFLDELANRAVIFLYISIPLSALSLVMVVLRNVF